MNNVHCIVMYVYINVQWCVLYTIIVSLYQISSQNDIILSYSLFRELKRLSTVTLSPIYAHFQETIMGLSTIRAMRASDRFMLENERRLELNQRANYAGMLATTHLHM